MRSRASWIALALGFLAAPCRLAEAAPPGGHTGLGGPGAGRTAAPSATSSDRDGELATRRAAVVAKAPSPTPAQVAGVEALHDRLGALGEGPREGPDDIRGLASALERMALHPPAEASTRSLAGGLYGALTGVALGAREMARLSQDLYALLNRADLEPAEVATLAEDVEAILLAAGCDRADVRAVLAALAELRDLRPGPSPPAAATP